MTTEYAATNFYEVNNADDVQAILLAQELTMQLLCDCQCLGAAETQKTTTTWVDLATGTKC